MATRSLPIFKELPPNPLDGITPLDADPSCNRCSHKGPRGSICIPDEGEPGGLLVLTSFPSAQEARAKRHLMGTLGAKLRQMANKAGMEVTYASALRCAPKPVPASESCASMVPGITSCLPYLAGTIEKTRPRRIIALGAGAIYALTNSVLTPSTNREGFAWVHLAHGWVPVFYAIDPVVAGKNKFLAAWLEQDFARAVHAAPATLPPIPGEGWAKLIITKDDAERCLSQMNTSRWTAVDCEWAGRPYDKDFKLLCLAMTPSCDTVVDGLPDLTSQESNSAWVWTQEALQNPECRSLLKAWLRDPNHKKVGSYFKADIVALHAALGIWTRGVTSDTRLLRKLMDAEASGRLADMAHLVGRGGHKDELKEAMQKAVGEYKRLRAKSTGGLFKVPLPGLADQSHADKIMAGAETEQYGFAFVDPDLLYRYNAADTVVTALVGSLLEHRLKQEPEGMQHVAKSVVLPASDTYARVESWGIRVDREALQTVGQYLDGRIEEASDRFRPYGYGNVDAKGEPIFNPGSTKHVGELLFKTLKLKSEKQTESGVPSTDVEALEALVDQHPVVKDILTWRGLTKMKSSYVDSILSFIRDDGRVHPTIHPDGARTGRTSSSAPNLQVMPSIESSDPVQAELARMFRDCFAAPHGYTLLEVDYSQLELRVAADLSGDSGMLEIFKENKDFHMQTAKLLSKTLWGIEPDEVTDTHRREVKPYAFGLLYDDSPHGLSFRLGVPVEKAEQIKEAVFGCFPKLAQWIQARVRETAKSGHAWTWWDGHPARRRPLIGVADLESSAGKTARRGSWNTPIQGTGNEYLVASANKVVEWLVGDGIPAKLLVTVHDSMLLEVRNDAISEVHATVLDIMCSHRTKNGVPLAADAKVGRTWASMVKWKKGQPCPLPDCL